MKDIVVALVGAAALVAAGCGSETEMMTGRDRTAMMTGPDGATGSPAFVSMSPPGGAMGVPAGSPLEFRWGTPMGVGMEQFIDLHMGDLSGPVVPMSCAWSGNQSTLVCTPGSPLQPGTQYMVHVGGGMVDVNGQVVDMDRFGPGYGGQWISGGGPGSGGRHGGAHHGGQPWGGLGPGWRHANGSYGMAFTFTTA